MTSFASAAATATANPPNIFDASGPAPPAGARATESVHRKVELQHPADWTFLVAQATNAAREKIDARFSGGADAAAAAAAAVGEKNKKKKNAEDAPQNDAAGVDQAALRERVVELVDEYIRTTYDAAKDSVAINGMDAREMDAELAKYQEGAELEPFDAKLAQRIQDLSAQVEEQTLVLANLRRKVPKESARAFRKSFETRSETLEQQLRAGEEAQMGLARATVVDAGPVQRAGEVQHIYQRGTEGLSALKAGMEGTVAKMERAQKASEVLNEK